MPDEDKTFRGSLVSDLRIWWRHVDTLYSPLYMNHRLSQSPFLCESSGAENGLFATAARQSTDQILGRRCVRGCGSKLSPIRNRHFIWRHFPGNPLKCFTLDHGIKMNVREAINFGLNKLNFENIRENQRKVVEAYLSGRDVLMISPTGSGKSLTFHIAPFAIDFFKHGERDDIQTVCLVILLISLMNDQVSSFRRWKRNQGCCCRSRQFWNWKQGSLRGQIQPCVHKLRSFVW